MRRKESRNQVTLQSSFFLIMIDLSSRLRSAAPETQAGQLHDVKGIHSAPSCLDRVCFARFSNWKRSKAPGCKVKEAVGLTYACVHASVQRGIEMSAGWRKCRWGCNADVRLGNERFSTAAATPAKFSTTCAICLNFISHLCFSAILFYYFTEDNVLPHTGKISLFTFLLALLCVLHASARQHAVQNSLFEQWVCVMLCSDAVEESKTSSRVNTHTPWVDKNFEEDTQWVRTNTKSSFHLTTEIWFQNSELVQLKTLEMLTHLIMII